MYDAPTMFWAVWQIVSPFIDPATKEKVTFVSSSSAVKEFQEAIDPSVSPHPSGLVAVIAPIKSYCTHVMQAQSADGARL